MSQQVEEVLRIEALSDAEVYEELKDIINGYKYSWHRINQSILEALDEGCLSLKNDKIIIKEWQNLCLEKNHWETRGRFSVESHGFYRDCLINLKLIPPLAGLNEYANLTTSNMDHPELNSIDLGILHILDTISEADENRMEDDEAEHDEDDDSEYEDGETSDDESDDEDEATSQEGSKGEESSEEE